MTHQDPRAVAESIDVKMGVALEKVLKDGQEVLSPTGEKVRVEPSPAMFKVMQSYVTMHGAASEDSARQKRITESLAAQRARNNDKAPALKFTGTDGKLNLAPENE